MSPLNDLWMRDTGPVFVKNEPGGRVAIDFNFNGWGKKQAFGRDAAVAAFVAQRAGLDVVQLNIDGIAAGGGGIHCTTQQEPLAS